MARVAVVGGGPAGCSAALAAAKAGAEVTLLERTDMLLGVAVRSGGMNGNGRFVGRHELGFLGGGELFDALESIRLYSGFVWPDTQKHHYIFDVGLAEPLFRRMVKEAGVQVHLESRVVDVERDGPRISSVKLKGAIRIEGEAFVDCTGSRGGIKTCTRYGNGCAECLVSCSAFGDPAGIVEKAGGRVFDKIRPDGTPGYLNAAISVFKNTLSPQLKARIEKGELVTIPLPSELVDYSKFRSMGAQRSREFVENIHLCDIGPVAKITGIVHMALEQLRTVPGFENVQVEDPRHPKYSHVQSVSIASSDASMKVAEFQNLFCGGGKAGCEGVSEAIISGCLAGHNAARMAAGREPLVLPRSLAIGDWIGYVVERYKTEEGRRNSYWMSRGEYWARMQSLGLYTPDVEQIRMRVEKAGLAGVFSAKREAKAKR